MSLTNDQIASMEARIRALEALVQSLPSVFTTEVFDLAREEVATPYRHPQSAGLVTIGRQAEQAAEALDEIERQMLESPAG